MSVELLVDAAAVARMGETSIATLTEKATNATFYRDDLSPEQIAANRRIVSISTDYCLAAAAADHQRFAAAFVLGRFAGYMVATVHEPEDRELDWMMVDPGFHGTGVAAALMRDGMAWLGAEREMWLNVIRHNERAIGFYRKFGFEVDPHAAIDRVVPHFIMRRPAGLAFG